MKRSIRTLGIVTALALTLCGAFLALASASGDDETPPAVAALPQGYRDWKLISVAHEEGSLNDIRAVLGNDAAIKAFRDKTPTFPDGAIIARLAWSYESSAENNKVFGRNQSFVAGQPTNVQIMIKDSRKYAATGGWGYGQFKNGKPEHISEQACYACHVPVKDRDFIFTRYAL